MAQYISKSTLVEEIESLKKFYNRFDDNIQSVAKYNVLVDIISFLDTLEVKEVDLDFQRFAKEMDFVFALPSSKTKNTEEEPLCWEYAIAKHFFELGIAVNNKAQKGEEV